MTVVFGTTNELLDREGDTRLCPSCGKASVTPFRWRKKAVFMFIPTIPISNKEIWFCVLCKWQAPYTTKETTLQYPSNEEGS